MSPRRRSTMPGSRVVVRNLDPLLDESMLIDTFSNFGDIVACRIENRNDSINAFAILGFGTLEAAANAVDHVDGMELAGRKLSVVLQKTSQSDGVHVTDLQERQSDARDANLTEVPRKGQKRKKKKNRSSMPTLLNCVLTDEDGDTANLLSERASMDDSMIGAGSAVSDETNSSREERASGVGVWIHSLFQNVVQQVKKPEQVDDEEADDDEEEDKQSTESGEEEEPSLLFDSTLQNDGQEEQQEQEREGEEQQEQEQQGEEQQEQEQQGEEQEEDAQQQPQQQQREATNTTTCEHDASVDQVTVPPVSAKSLQSSVTSSKLVGESSQTPVLAKVEKEKEKSSTPRLLARLTRRSRQTEPVSYDDHALHDNTHPTDRVMLAEHSVNKMGSESCISVASHGTDGQIAEAREKEKERRKPILSLLKRLTSKKSTRGLGLSDHSVSNSNKQHQRRRSNHQQKNETKESQQQAALLSDNGGTLQDGDITTDLPSLMSDSTEISGTKTNPVVHLSVGGVEFTTVLSTLLQSRSSVLAQMFASGVDGLVTDDDGRVFVDRDGTHFGTILNFLRDGGTSCFPEPGTSEWASFKHEARHYQTEALLQVIQDKEHKHSQAQRLALLEWRLKGQDSTTDLIHMQAKEIELMKIEIQKLKYERAKEALFKKHAQLTRDTGKQHFFAFNCLVAGVTGSGKSSSLNTLLDSPDNLVSGGQAQGTRGTVMKDGKLDQTRWISYVDSQGLGADTSISDQELLAQIMTCMESIQQLGIINAVVISIDLSVRSTPSAMANLLTLCEVFADLRQSCFLCFTKWNVNGVIADWLLPLKTYVRKNRRAADASKLKGEPPSYAEMYMAYTNYVAKSMANEQDGGGFTKLATFLAFFESRVVWMYNLDTVQVEDRAEGCLEPYIQHLYTHYRNQAISTLISGSTVVKVNDMMFLHESDDTMVKVASNMISTRDAKIQSLETTGRDKRKRKEVVKVFKEMAVHTAESIANARFVVDDQYTDRIAELAGMEARALGRRGDGQVRCSIM